MCAWAGHEGGSGPPPPHAGQLYLDARWAAPLTFALPEACAKGLSSRHCRGPGRRAARARATFGGNRKNRNRRRVKRKESPCYLAGLVCQAQGGQQRPEPIDQEGHDRKGERWRMGRLEVGACTQGCHGALAPAQSPSRLLSFPAPTSLARDTGHGPRLPNTTARSGQRVRFPPRARKTEE